MNKTLLRALYPVHKPLDKPIGRKQPWTISTKVGKVTIQPLSAEISRERIAAPACIGVVVGGVDVTLLLPCQILDVLCSRRENGLEWQKLEDAVKPLILEYLFEDILEKLEDAVGAGITIKDVSLTAEADFIPNFGFEVRNGDVVIPVCGSFSSAHLKSLLSWQSKLPTATYAGLSASVCFRKGVATISSADLRSLRLGDAIVLEVSETSHIWAVTEERFLAELVEDGDGLRLVGLLLARPPKAMEQLMSDNPGEDYKNRPLPGSVGDIPIRLSFDVGRIEIPLSELEAIGEGHVFQIDRQKTQSVEIIAQGRIIGRGEIVIVDGLTAVRVTAFND